MQPFSLDADWIGQCVREVLHWPPETKIKIDPVSGTHRNNSYRVEGLECIFIKLAADDAERKAFEREAVALEAMKDEALAVRYLAHGDAGDGHPAWIITAAAPGVPLSHVINEPIENIMPALKGLQRVLGVLRDSESLATSLSKLEERLSGPWAPDFQPAKWLSEQNHPLSSQLVGMRSSGAVVLHGSLDPGNLLVRSGGCCLWFCALLDFEGSRRGPLGLDEATLWYKLALAGRFDVAEAWCQLVLSDAHAELLSGFVSSAAWLSTFRCVHAHPEREADIAISAEISRRLAQLLDFATQGRHARS